MAPVVVFCRFDTKVYPKIVCIAQFPKSCDFVAVDPAALAVIFSFAGCQWMEIREIFEEYEACLKSQFLYFGAFLKSFLNQLMLNFELGQNREEKEAKMKKIPGIWALIFLFAFSASAARADFVNVPASAFRGDTESEDFNCDGIYVVKPSTGGLLYASVNLPDGVVIKNMRLLYQDNSTDYNLTATLWRMNMFTGGSTALFLVSTSGASPTSQSLVDSTTSVPANRMVYNNVLQYCVSLYFHGGDSNIRVYGVTIEY
jgi:hypothetical protein